MFGMIFTATFFEIVFIVTLFLDLLSGIFFGILFTATFLDSLNAYFKGTRENALFKVAIKHAELKVAL